MIRISATLMLDSASSSLGRMAIGCFITAILLYVGAVARSRAASVRRAASPNHHQPTKDLSDVLMAFATALITGGAIATTVFFLQQDFIQQRDRETRLLMTADLSGYDPGPSDTTRGQLVHGTNRCVENRPTVEGRRFLKARYLASKNLRGARFGGINLERTEFRGADLSGAIFRCASLVGADFISADLSRSDLLGADLSRADLRGASLEGATLPAGSAWNGVKVNAQTCWPEGVDIDTFKRWGLRPWPVHGHAGRAYGHFCGENQVIREPWVHFNGSVPLAPNETRLNKVPVVRLDASALRQLAQSRHETSAPKSALPPAAPAHDLGSTVTSAAPAPYLRPPDSAPPHPAVTAPTP